jgi:hypothetical protein
VSSTEYDPRKGEIRSTFTSTTGGVMTEVAGAVTGDLEIATRPEGDTIEVMIRYAGADEWYSVEGGPISLANAALSRPDELRELHRRVLSHLTTPGRVVAGNELPTSLGSFPAEP